MEVPSSDATTNPYFNRHPERSPKDGVEEPVLSLPK